MDEVTRSVLLLVLGALLSFVPQELSKRFQDKRDAEKEKRAAKQQRQLQMWQRELEKLTAIENTLSKTHEMMVAGRHGMIDSRELSYMYVTFMRYPLLKQAHRRYLIAENDYLNLLVARKGNGTPSTEESEQEKQASDNLDNAIINLLKTFENHMARME